MSVITPRPRTYEDIKALSDRHESPIALPDTFNGLFDSRRDYLKQLEFYKAVAP